MGGQLCEILLKSRFFLIPDLLDSFEHTRDHCFTPPFPRVFLATSRSSMAIWPRSSGKANESNTDPIDSRDCDLHWLRLPSVSRFAFKRCLGHTQPSDVVKLFLVF